MHRRWRQRETPPITVPNVQRPGVTPSSSCPPPHADLKPVARSSRNAKGAAILKKKGFFLGPDMDAAVMARHLRGNLSPCEYVLKVLRHTLLNHQLKAVKRTLHRHVW